MTGLIMKNVLFWFNYREYRKLGKYKPLPSLGIGGLSIQAPSPAGRCKTPRQNYLKSPHKVCKIAQFSDIFSKISSKMRKLFSKFSQKLFPRKTNQYKNDT